MAQKVLSKEFSVLLYIYIETELKKNNIDFSNILKNNKEYSQTELSNVVDKLYDHMMIDAKWSKIEDDKWSYCYYVSEEFMGFTKGLYNAVDIYDEDGKKINKKSFEKKEYSSKKSELKNKVDSFLNQKQKGEQEIFLKK